jgi:hypothetical protein
MVEMNTTKYLQSSNACKRIGDLRDAEQIQNSAITEMFERTEVVLQIGEETDTRTAKF